MSQVAVGSVSRVGLLLGWGLALCLNAWASPESASSESLPEPLTLAAALAVADSEHPDLQLAAADRDLARAGRDSVAATTGVKASLLAEARYVEPSPLAVDQSHNDSQASLIVSKQLYDFGRSAARLDAAGAELKSRDLSYLQARLRHRLDVIARYLDVLLADYAFRVEDEAMAIAYVRLDDIRDRHELGQVSDVKLLEQQTHYEEVRTRRYQAQSRQRTARVRLAEALGRPDQLSIVLNEPNLTGIDRALPELASLQTEILATSPDIAALRAEVEAAQQQLAAAQAQWRPVLSGQVEANEYHREFGSRDKWRAGVTLEVPLLTGGSYSADVAAARARLRRSKAELARRQLQMRQDLATLWEEMRVLQAQRQETRTRQDYRELYLDRSRALYEMEVKTDLGDAMVRSTEAKLEAVRVDYQLLLDWAKLSALKGQLPEADKLAQAE